jgi:hypothetical protein
MLDARGQLLGPLVPERHAQDEAWTRRYAQSRPDGHRQRFQLDLKLSVFQSRDDKVSEYLVRVLRIVGPRRDQIAKHHLYRRASQSARGRIVDQLHQVKVHAAPCPTLAGRR